MRQIVVSLHAVLLTLALVACASNPYKYSTTPEQIALSTYEAGSALVHVAATMWVDPEIDMSVRQPVHDAALQLVPVLNDLKAAAVAVEQAKAAIAAGSGTPEQLQIALDLLAQSQSNTVAPMHALTEVM